VKKTLIRQAHGRILIGDRLQSIIDLPTATKEIREIRLKKKKKIIMKNNLAAYIFSILISDGKHSIPNNNIII